MSIVDVSKIFQEFNLVGFSDLSNDGTYDYTLPLKHVPRSKLQDYLAFLINYNLHQDFDDSFETFISKYFGNKTPKYADPLFKFNADLFRHVNFAKSLHNRNSCLELFQYVTANGMDFTLPDGFDEEKAKYNVLLSVLAINDRIKKKNLAKYEQAKVSGTEESLLHCQISINIELYDQIIFNLTEYSTQSFKLFYLAHFLESNQKTKMHFKWILMFFRCYNKEHFIANILELINNIQQANEENYFTFELSPDNANLNNFIARFINLKGFTERSVDFVELKEYPIIHKEGRKFQIVFLRYCIDKLFKSLYFLLDEINAHLGPSERHPNFRETFTTDFTEKFLCNSIFKDLLGTEGTLMTDSDIANVLYEQKLLKKGISPSLPDFFHLSKNDVFFFELKDTLISGDIKAASTAIETITFLSDRFNYMSEDKKKKKGIPQLIGYIEDLLSGKYPYASTEKTTSIYTILLLTDDIYNVIGLNYLMNSWFQKRLNEISNSEIRSKVQIMPLCVITLDTMILYSYFFEKKIISFTEMIKHYVADCLPTDTIIENVYPPSRSQLPFSMYLKNHLLNLGHELDEDSMMHVFNKAWDFR